MQVLDDAVRNDVMVVIGVVVCRRIVLGRDAASRQSGTCPHTAAEQQANQCGQKTEQDSCTTAAATVRFRGVNWRLGNLALVCRLVIRIASI